MDEYFDFEVLEAASGEEALEYIDNDQPDLILLDNKLPGIQGVEVLEYVRKNNLDIIVVMITSYASLELAVKATSDGAYDFIPKPFTPQELKASLENITKQLFLKRITRDLDKEGKQVRFQFLSVLSHELKAPINAVEGYLNIIKEQQMGESVSDYLEMIDRYLARISGMRNLILDMLDLTKIESGKMSQNLEKLDLVTLAKESIETMMPLARDKGISITLDSPESMPITADPEEMEIILNNLISNAVKYNKDNGKVDCKLNIRDNKYILEVSDTGIGMDDEEINKLFKEFVRIKNRKTKHITGSGLGLSIVKKLVELNEGQISVKSEPDIGTSFTIEFDLKD
jgi:signal transduction histidine kinase